MDWFCAKCLSNCDVNGENIYCSVCSRLSYQAYINNLAWHQYSDDERREVRKTLLRKIKLLNMSKILYAEDIAREKTAKEQT